MREEKKYESSVSYGTEETKRRKKSMKIELVVGIVLISLNIIRHVNQGIPNVPYGEDDLFFYLKHYSLLLIGIYCIISAIIKWVRQ